MYGLEILLQRGKRVKTKSQTVLMANSYVCRSNRRKTRRRGRTLQLREAFWLTEAFHEDYLWRF